MLRNLTFYWGRQMIKKKKKVRMPKMKRLSKKGLLKHQDGC